MTGAYSREPTISGAKRVIQQHIDGEGTCTQHDALVALMWAVLRLLELHPEIMS